MYDQIICNFNNIYKAYRRARCGKRHKASEARFEADAIEAALSLKEILQRRAYYPRPLFSFYVNEPKHREIKAPALLDKVVMHLLCDNILYSNITASWIRDNYASQIGKGVDDGIRRLKHHMRNYYKLYGADGWILKCDISKFFASIPLNLLEDEMRSRISDPDVMELIRRFIYATEELPLGYQSSQLFASMMLDKLDHKLKEACHVKFYGRYMDDFYIIHNDKNELKELLEVIKSYMTERSLILNKKTQIFPLRNGIDFLGFHTYLNDDGSIVMKLRRASKERMRRKLKLFKQLYAEGKITKERIDHSYQSWRAHAKRGNCYYLILKFDEIYANIFKEEQSETSN